MELLQVRCELVGYLPRKQGLLCLQLEREQRQQVKYRYAKCLFQLVAWWHRADVSVKLSF